MAARRIARVPFLIRYPRAIHAGLVMPDPFSTVDVYPTLASLAGLKAPTGIDGMDYSGLLTGKSARRRGTTRTCR